MSFSFLAYYANALVALPFCVEAPYLLAKPIALAVGLCYYPEFVFDDIVVYSSMWNVIVELDCKLEFNRHFDNGSFLCTAWTP
jgi:hypothetical protein